MNRRELAKNGFLALCGALIGTAPAVSSPPVTYTFGGSAVPWSCVVDPDEDGIYSLSDGTEIEHD